VSKQKIILFISILVLVALIVFFYFYVISQKTYITIEPTPKSPQVVFEEEVLEDLNTFETPTSKATIPYSAPDVTIKNDAEIKNEIDSYVPENNTINNEEIFRLLSDPKFKAY
jgi:flagellar basal body-associated protein FliL